MLKGGYGWRGYLREVVGEGSHELKECTAGGGLGYPGGSNEAKAGGG